MGEIYLNKIYVKGSNCSFHFWYIFKGLDDMGLYVNNVTKKYNDHDTSELASKIENQLNVSGS